MHGAALGAAMSVAALTLASGESIAQTQELESISLRYEEAPPAGCPTSLQFQAEVTKLTSKARFTKEPGARRIRIELERRGAGVVGRFTSGDDKMPSSREVRGRDCAEVSSALAIAVALTIDPEALEAGTSPSPSEQPQEPGLSAATPARPSSVTKPPEPASGGRANGAAPIRFGVGVALAVETAWAPQIRVGGGLTLLLGLGSALTLAAGATRFPPRQQGDTSFGAWMGHGSLAWSLAQLGIARPFLAASYEAGVVESAGTRLARSMAAERPWQAAGFALGLRLETQTAFLELSGGAVFPLSRQRYLVSDTVGRTSTLYEGPAIGLKQETRLGVFL